MSSSPAVEQSPPPTTPSSPSQRAAAQLDYLHQYTSTPNYLGRKPNPPLNVILPPVGPSTPSIPSCEPTPTPPPRSPGAACAAGDGRTHPPPDGTSSDKSSETAVGGVVRTPSSVLSRKESYKAQRQHYRREKKRAASALLHSIEDPAAVVLADWLKVRGSLKSWTKLWCVLKPGLLLLYKSPKAKSSHWVGTVLLTSCQVIERPSKKDGFCFKLYHPLEQSIWAPRGPHNETIGERVYCTVSDTKEQIKIQNYLYVVGAVVQPLPTAHLIFRAPSQAAGHCWLDGLELALRCSNAMLRCSRSRGSAGSAGEAGAPGEAAGVQPPAQLSHEELEKHFNEHGRLTSQSSPLMSTSDYSGTRSRDSSDYERKSNEKPFGLKEKIAISKWTHLFDCSIDKREDANIGHRHSKSLSASPANLKLVKCMPFIDNPLKRMEGTLSPSSLIEERVLKFVASSFPKRRSSTPSAKVAESLRRPPSVKTPKSDSDNDDVFLKPHEVNRIIVTAPSSERIRNYTSSTSDSEKTGIANSEKYSLIDGDRLPSRSFEVSNTERREDRISSQKVYMAGRIVAREIHPKRKSRHTHHPEVIVVTLKPPEVADLGMHVTTSISRLLKSIRCALINWLVSYHRHI
ncbi:Oxysterol-binding protein-related protein 8 [Eumeta japonica]|uniref:Oxysterol-binding protein-related protein 8 n=1 Tax=Eumeta variegata TaxID=151549 RepID=A0A4C1YWT5_EUMVA|nr:Oxysterol-binding protein-related protein 8 [Eumeta japonica]